MDIDYGRLTIVIDPGATSAALHCENVYNKRLDVTYTENEPLDHPLQSASPTAI